MMAQRGFTLIESIMTIMLIVIIILFAMPRLPDVSPTKAGALIDKLQADVRYAQNLAMTRHQRARVTFQINGYTVTLGGNPVADPATGGNFSVTLNAGDYAGVSITSIGFSGNYVEFDSLGVPYDSGGALAAAKSVTVTGGQTITVAAQTGAVN
jgi:prepilin-type N-terminal cleavage/methylation domain-containing protein